jgi:Amt family ammonium transporter
VKAIGLTLTLSVVGTAILGLALKAVLGLRPTVEGEELGLDETDHGEAGYHPEELGAHGPEPIVPGAQAATAVKAAT